MEDPRASFRLSAGPALGDPACYRLDQTWKPRGFVSKVFGVTHSGYWWVVDLDVRDTSTWRDGLGLLRTQAPAVRPIEEGRRHEDRWEIVGWVDRESLQKALRQVGRKNPLGSLPWFMGAARGVQARRDLAEAEKALRDVRGLKATRGMVRGDWVEVCCPKCHARAVVEAGAPVRVPHRGSCQGTPFVVGLHTTRKRPSGG